MNVLFDIGHPAHVHMFKHPIWLLREKGLRVLVTVKDIPQAIQLLTEYDIEYQSLGRKYDSLLLKGMSQLIHNLNLLRISRANKIDIAVGSSLTVAQTSRLHKMKSIVMDDDDNEAVKLFVKFAHPFAHHILSPDVLAHQRNGKKDITYAGGHELMYLHPDNFVPDPEVLAEINIERGQPFFVLRFVASKAYHDIGQSGLTLENKKQLIERLLPHGKVLITSEREIEKEFEPYRIRIPANRIHHLLYYATLFIGDSQTMTTEAALLGTPALKCNTFAGNLSLPNELENKYDLCYSFQPAEFKQLIERLDNLLKRKDLKLEWQQKCTRIFSDKINVSKFLVWIIEHYPESIRILKSDPEYQYRFRGSEQTDPSPGLIR